MQPSESRSPKSHDKFTVCVKPRSAHVWHRRSRQKVGNCCNICPLARALRYQNNYRLLYWADCWLSTCVFISTLCPDVVCVFVSSLGWKTLTSWPFHRFSLWKPLAVQLAKLLKSVRIITSNVAYTHQGKAEACWPTELPYLIFDL